jgi:hypothetical protein
LVNAVHWIVDPAGALPPLPPPLPPGVGDNGDAVAEHDAIESEYYRLYNSSAFTQWRMRVEASDSPLDPTTTRQILIATVAALWAWRLRKSA